MESRFRKAMFAPDPPTRSKAETAELLLREAVFRQMQPLALYQPTPTALAFHKCTAPERLALGSNRSGKTTTAMAEVAMAVTGRHPWLPYPKKHGRAVLVAKDNKQIAEVLYRKLFRPGLFQMIPDAETKMWRIYEPWRDEPRKHLVRPSLPLIPQRMIRSVAWENKAQRIPSLIQLSTDWDMLFFSSLGKPPQGIDIDLVSFDEEIRDSDWYPECAARLIDRSGRFVWSATPQSATDRLFECHERAEKDRNSDEPVIREFTFLLSDNPYLAERDKLLFARKFEDDPEQYKVRVEGQFLIISYLVYPNFNMLRHGCEWFQVPADWSRYMVVDPGWANTIVAFFAIPPDESHVYLYDELYLKNKTTKEFAQEVKLKVQGQNIQEFIIDRCGSRKTEIGSGKTIAQQMAEELEKVNVRCAATGSRFVLVGPDGPESTEQLKAGINQVRSWLWERDNKPPHLRILKNACPNFVQEMTHYRNRKDQPDLPESRKWSHGPDTLRYFVMHNPRYVVPRKTPKAGNPIQNFLKEKRRKKRLKDGNFVLMG